MWVLWASLVASAIIEITCFFSFQACWCCQCYSHMTSVSLTCQTPVWAWKIFGKLHPKEFSFFQHFDHGKIPIFFMLNFEVTFFFFFFFYHNFNTFILWKISLKFEIKMWVVPETHLLYLLHKVTQRNYWKIADRTWTVETSQTSVIPWSYIYHTCEVGPKEIRDCIAEMEEDGYPCLQLGREYRNSLLS